MPPTSNSDRLLAGLRALAPAAALVVFAYGAVNRIQNEATTAIARVASAVTDVQLKQARHEAKDDERHENLVGRVTRVEERQDSLEGTLSALGISAALPPERKRPRPTSMRTE